MRHEKQSRWRSKGTIFFPIDKMEAHAQGLMTDTVESLILDLLEWVASRERTYEEVMEAWCTSCPRQPVWEDANDRGLITLEHAAERSVVRITPAGIALLEQRRSLAYRTSLASRT
jgi:hypothetical protein